jgi:hypothetical protein
VRGREPEMLQKQLRGHEEDGMRELETLEMFANGSRMPDSGRSRLALQQHNELYIAHFICVVFMVVLFMNSCCMPTRLM